MKYYYETLMSRVSVTEWLTSNHGRVTVVSICYEECLYIVFYHYNQPPIKKKK